jgi:arsenate reductase
MSQLWSEDAERIRALRPRHVLFLCVANSARSQMAAGLASAMAPTVKVSSAGSRPTAVHPLAIEVLADLGVDIRQNPSLRIDEIPPDDVDVVITLSAEDVGAEFKGRAHRVHWPLPGPAAIGGAEASRLHAFTLVRDELMRRLAVVFGNHPSDCPSA